MLTIKELLPLLYFGDCVETEHEIPKLSVTSNGLGAPIDLENEINMAAFGDFIISRIHVDKYGVEIAIKTEFCKAGA